MSLGVRLNEIKFSVLPAISSACYLHKLGIKN